MQRSTSHGGHKTEMHQQDVINCNNLFSKFNESNHFEKFANNVIPSNLMYEETLKTHAEKIFKVLSCIAGSDDKQLTDQQKEKLQESGFFMKLVDKLLDLIYSAAEKFMSWTSYGTARNRSASFIKSFENESKKISERDL